MLRDATPDDRAVVVRATPATREEAIDDTVESANESAKVYVVPTETDDATEALYGVSVFEIDPGSRNLTLTRFDTAPTYLETTVAAVRQAGIRVLPTGTDEHHFDVQLLSGRYDVPDDPGDDLIGAATAFVDVCGPLRPNPAYAGDLDRGNEAR
jgi:hypothetical protein